MAVAFQAGRGLAGRIPGIEQELYGLAVSEAAQRMARLDIVQRAAVGGEVYRLTFFFTPATLMFDSDALRSSWRSMSWHTAPASAVHASSASVSCL